MKEKQIKNPGPDHPISIQRNRARVVVSVAGRVIADTRNALALREADYPAVQYIPRGDVDLTQLERTDHVTYCPYKGDCNYYSVPAGGKKSVNAVALGVIDTDMSKFTKTDSGRELTLGMQALKRIGKPDDVADVIAFPGFGPGALDH